MLLHEQNRNFLSDLHRQFGSDHNALRPVNGGSLRGTMASFERIPAAVRLDVIHPMTHCVLYRRWMDMELCDVEDYHLLHSLIGSICPEIGSNFLLYWTHNGCFKSSNEQYPIDTNPALRTLQQQMAQRGDSKAIVTAISVLPTFVLCDSFEESAISLSCSRRDVSWKVINPTVKEEEEKALASSLNLNGPKPLEFASGWFPAEGVWKWQFMNDDRQFQDFKDSNNRIMERHFKKGLTFGTFHRLKVQYQANFKSMVQKNLKSGNIRTIRRVPSSVKGAAAAPAVPMVTYLKWQFEDEHGVWTDYPVANSKQLNELKIRSDSRAQSWNYVPFHSQNTMTIRMKSGHNSKWYRYDIDVYHMKQRNTSTLKQRRIRQIPVHEHGHSLNLKGKSGRRGPAQHRWEWQDDDGTFKRYDDSTSALIEGARCSGIQKYFFVSTKNQNSYEITFSTMLQINIQSGRQRKVQRLRLEAPWKGPGPNPKSWSGPLSTDRRTFGEKMLDLYSVVGAVAAKEVRKSGKYIRGQLGPFGSGLYFYDSKEIAIHMAKHRTAENRGQLVSVRVFVGAELDVSNLDDKQFDFRSLQKAGKDAVTRSLGFGNEYIVYNADQVCVVEVEKY